MCQKNWFNRQYTGRKQCNLEDFEDGAHAQLEMKAAHKWQSAVHTIFLRNIK